MVPRLPTTCVPSRVPLTDGVARTFSVPLTTCTRAPAANFVDTAALRVAVRDVVGASPQLARPIIARMANSGRHRASPEAGAWLYDIGLVLSVHGFPLPAHAETSQGARTPPPGRFGSHQFALVTTKTSKTGPVRGAAFGAPPMGVGGVTPPVGSVMEPP